MIPPALAVQRLLRSIVLGFAIGPAMALLSPLRRRFPVCYQLLVCLCLLPAWLYLSFEI